MLCVISSMTVMGMTTYTPLSNEYDMWCMNDCVCFDVLCMIVIVGDMLW